MGMKKNYSIPEDLTWEGDVYDTHQIFIPKQIRDKMPQLVPGIKARFGVIAIIEVKKREILGKDVKSREEQNGTGKKTTKKN